MDEKKLSEREALFCRYYSAGIPGEEAARLSGYSPRTAEAVSKRILKKEGAKERIETLKGGETGSLDDEITEFLLSIMRGDGHDEKNDIKERMRAAELLGKRRADGGEEKSKVVILDDIPGKN